MICRRNCTRQTEYERSTIRALRVVNNHIPNRMFYVTRVGTIDPLLPRGDAYGIQMQTCTTYDTYDIRMHFATKM